MNSFEEQIAEILITVKKIAKEENKLSGFCIGNTRKVNSTGLYFSPIRNTSRLVAGSAIVYSVEQAIEIVKAVDGKVDYLLVDSEKKISPELYGSGNVGNVERAVRENSTKSKIIVYKGNDLTVDSIDQLLIRLLPPDLRGISSYKVSIIGAGNLGSKLALKLVERGVPVTITRRNIEKLKTIVSALNMIKPKETIAEVKGTTDNELAAVGAQVLIGMTEGTPAITSTMIDRLAKNAIIFDAGKGCIFPDAIQKAEEKNIPIYRVDIRPGFEGHVSMVLETDRIVSNTVGRSVIEKVSVVSGGLLGRHNEVVVDNIHEPKSVFGLADGTGDFVRVLSDEQKLLVQTVKKHILNKGTL